MGDSDDEYDRRKGRDKFRRERNDYDHRGRDERRRDQWEHERSSRSRDGWTGRGRDNRADNYGRDYDRGRRDNRGYSPRRDISPPHPKRMRRNWYGRDDGGYPMYDMPPYGGGPMHSGGPPPNWGPGPEMGPPPGGPYGGGPGQNRIDPDFPTQPPMMTFKQFLGQQEDSISDQDAIKKYNEYKVDFQKQQISEFFLAHKEEEWFKSKYHPEECEKRRKEVISALKRRCSVFLDLLDGTYFEDISVDTEKHESLVKLLDAAVIKMEGGTDFDLSVLDEPEDEVEGARSRNNSETHPVDKSPEEKIRKRKREDSKEEKNPDQPLEITITGEQKELMRKAQEYTKKQQQQEQNEDEEKKGKKKKRQRDKTEYSYEEWKDKPEMIPKGSSYYEHDNREDFFSRGRGRGFRRPFRGGFRGRFRGRGFYPRGGSFRSRGFSSSSSRERDRDRTIKSNSGAREPSFNDEWKHDLFDQIEKTETEKDKEPSSTT